MIRDRCDLRQSSSLAQNEACALLPAPHRAFNRGGQARVCPITGQIEMLKLSLLRRAQARDPNRMRKRRIVFAYDKGVHWCCLARRWKEAFHFARGKGDQFFFSLFGGFVRATDDQRQVLQFLADLTRNSVFVEDPFNR